MERPSKSGERRATGSAPRSESLTASLLEIEAAVVEGEYEGQAALQRIVSTIASLPDVAEVTIAVTQGAELVTFSSAKSGAAGGGEAVPDATELYRESMGQGRMVRCEDLASDARVGESSRNRFGSAIVMPLRSRRCTMGALAVFSERKRVLGEQHILALGIAATLCATILTDILQDAAPAKAAAPSNGKDTAQAPEAKAVVSQRSDAALREAMAEIASAARLEIPDEPPRRSSPWRVGWITASILLLVSVVFGSMQVLRGSRSPVAQTTARPRVEFSSAVRSVGKPTVAEEVSPSRTGGKVAQGRLLQQVLPAYPAAAMQSRIEGEVQAVLTVDEKGTVRDVRITQGEPVLAAATSEALFHWRFTPYFIDGRSGGVPVQIPVSLAFHVRSYGEAAEAR